MQGPSDESLDLSAVPLFPLPNVVLFPGAVLPLHIFEERYKTMTVDALRGRKQIAMALLQPGWEKSYYDRPKIEPVVCVGSILTHEKLPDGTFNFLLQGRTRARIVRESGHHSYRVAELQPLVQINTCELDLSNQRLRLIELFDGGTLLATGIGRQFRQLLGGPLSTAAVADLIAFNFLDDVQLRQALLSECDVAKRVAATVDALEQGLSAVPSAPVRAARDPNLN